MEREDVGGDPFLGGGKFCEGRDVGVGDGYGDGDVCVGEGAEDGRVCVEDFNVGDCGLGFEESGDGCGWWEVVGDGAVVDADVVGGGGGRLKEEVGS